MSKTKKIAVYCSSAPDLPADLKETAVELGRQIGRLGCTLIYGGVNAGLMHDVALGASETGAEIVGVIPEFFMHRADLLCTTVIATSDLTDRKARMINEADIFVVLPGGLGTIDEWVSTASQIMASRVCDESCRRPIVVYNREGMFDHMIAQFAATNSGIFSRGRHADAGIIASTPQELFDTLASLTTRN